MRRAGRGRQESEAPRGRTGYRARLLAGLLLLGLAAAAPPAGAARSDLFLLEAAPNVQRVVFEGNRRFGSRELSGQVATHPGAWTHPFRDSRLVKSQLEQDVQTLIGFYRARGYLRAQVTAVAIQRDDGAEVRFTIHEGEPVQVATVDLRGLERAERERLGRRLRTQRQRPLNPYQLENDRLLVQGWLADNGHPLGRVEENALIAGDSAQVTLSATPGPEVRFGRVEFAGGSGIARWPIQREVTFKPGQTFSRREVARTTQRLYDTGLFNDVVFVPDTTASGDSLGGTFRLRQRRHHWLSAGVGYSNTAGSNFIRLSAEWGSRNLFHTARGLSFKTQNSFDLPPSHTATESFLRLREHRDNLRLVQPWLFGARLRGELGGFFGYDNIRIITVRQTSYGFTAGVAKELRERVANVSLNFEARWVKNKVDAGQNIDSLDVQLRRPRYSTRLGGVLYTWDGRDDFINPTRGHHYTVQAQYAGGIFGGDNNFDKLALGASAFRRTGRRAVLATRLSLAGVNPLNSSSLPLDVRPVDIVPVEDRLYLGGSASVRGYQENTINGVDRGTDPNGGGLVSLLANVELRFGLVGSLGGVLFVDVGNVWVNRRGIQLGRLAPTFGGDSATLDNVRYSIGGGLRLNTPVGPIRLEGAYRLSPRHHDLPQDLHFGIGQTF